MKLKSLIVLASLISLIISFPAHADLIAYWDFEEGSGTTAYDTVGGYHGTISGATYTTDAAPGGGQYALLFDEFNDRVSVPHAASLSFLANVQSFSFSAWVKTSDPTGGRIVEKKQWTHNGYSLSVNSTPPGVTCILNLKERPKKAPRLMVGALPMERTIM